MLFLRLKKASTGQKNKTLRIRLYTKHAEVMPNFQCGKNHLMLCQIIKEVLAWQGAALIAKTQGYTFRVHISFKKALDLSNASLCWHFLGLFPGSRFPSSVTQVMTNRPFPIQSTYLIKTARTPLCKELLSTATFNYKCLTWSQSSMPISFHV